MAVLPFFAGSDITAAILQSIAPLNATKGSDETVTSSTALQPDDELFVPVVANAGYTFMCFLSYEGGTQGSSDIAWKWAVPSGALMIYTGVWVGTGGGVEVGTGSSPANPLSRGGTTNTAGTAGTGNPRGIFMNGQLLVAGTAGFLQLQWAQNTSSATGTIVHAQSCLNLWRNS